MISFGPFLLPNPHRSIAILVDAEKRRKDPVPSLRLVAVLARLCSFFSLFLKRKQQRETKENMSCDSQLIFLHQHI